MLTYINSPLKRYGRRIIVCAVLLILISTVTAFTFFWPKYEQSFFELGLLGENRKAEQYYKDNDPNINISSRINWYIYVHNYMHTPQFVNIKVKLLNSTMLPPNDRLHLPSPFPPLVEYSVSLNTNGAVVLPFSWSILNASRSGDSIVIDRLTVDNSTVSSEVYSSSSNMFRLVFELWVYNQTSQKYDFGWRSGSDYGSASVFMWFNLILD